MLLLLICVRVLGRLWLRVIWWCIVRISAMAKTGILGVHGIHGLLIWLEGRTRRGVLFVAARILLRILGHGVARCHGVTGRFRS